MKSLLAPAPLNNNLRLVDWSAEVTIKESSFGTVIPQAWNIAERAVSKIKRQKGNPLKFYGDAHTQIVEDEIESCVKLHRAGLTFPPKYKFTITVEKRGYFVTAKVESVPE